MAFSLEQLDERLAQRAKASPEDSYTAKLLRDGVDRCARKFGEEAIETIVSAVARDNAGVANEAADVLYHLPFRYQDRRDLRPLRALHPGEEATAVGRVARVHEGRAGRRGRRVLEVLLRDEDGLLLLVWFNKIPYFSRRFREGQRLVVHGKVEAPLGGRSESSHSSVRASMG